MRIIAQVAKAANLGDFNLVVKLPDEKAKEIMVATPNVWITNMVEKAPEEAPAPKEVAPEVPAATPGPAGTVIVHTPAPAHKVEATLVKAPEKVPVKVHLLDMNPVHLCNGEFCANLQTKLLQAYSEGDNVTFES